MLVVSSEETLGANFESAASSRTLLYCTYEVCTDVHSTRVMCEVSNAASLFRTAELQ